MIDSTTTISITEESILYSIDFKNLIKNSLPGMIEYLKVYSDYYPHTYKPSISPAIGLSLQEQKIMIDTKNNDHKLIAVYNQKESSLEQTITDWANVVVKRYFQWLKKQYNTQRNLLRSPINYSKLAEFIYSETDPILFDQQKLLLVILNNLNNRTAIDSDIINGLIKLTKLYNTNTIAITILKLLQNAVKQNNKLQVNYNNADNKETALIAINQTIDEVQKNQKESLI